MRLNVNGSFDVKKNEHSPSLSLKLFSSIYFVFVFCTKKMDALTLSLIIICIK